MQGNKGERSNVSCLVSDPAPTLSAHPPGPHPTFSVMPWSVISPGHISLAIFLPLLCKLPRPDLCYPSEPLLRPTEASIKPLSGLRSNGPNPGIEGGNLLPPSLPRSFPSGSRTQLCKPWCSSQEQEVQHFGQFQVSP